jgi:hypothetical protein
MNPSVSAKRMYYLVNQIKKQTKLKLKAWQRQNEIPVSKLEQIPKTTLYHIQELTERYAYAFQLKLFE